jgi:hypothetical protein
VQPVLVDSRQLATNGLVEILDDSRLASHVVLLPRSAKDELRGVIAPAARL